MNEYGFWQLLKAGMRKYWLATRIENSVSVGIPDVTFAMKDFFGWIELKYIPMWPKKPSTVIKLRLNPHQRAWFVTHGRVCDDIWSLCRIQDDIFLLTWQQALSAMEGWTEDQWHKRSHYHWHKNINFKHLHHMLKRGR